MERFHRGIGDAGTDERTGALFSYVDLEERVRGDHRLWAIWAIVNAAMRL